MPVVLPLAAAVGVISLVLAWWLFIIWLAATFFGWQKLAARFRADRGQASGAETTYFRFQSISVGLANYGGCVTLGVGTAGLHIAIRPAILFPFHPPLFIPWPDLDVIQVRDGFFARDLIVHVGQPLVARMHLPLKILEAAEKMRPKHPSQ